ncbi:MAG: circadian clock protein KaiB [Chlorobiales bacterium]|jgi:circadian clock protein KaiB|nr:circadian clock protein KaiB [Chlorobiales bacterium]
MAKFLFKLYITGRTPRSEMAMFNLRRICEDILKMEYDLIIIDVLEKPQLAEDDRIMATPTLIKELPSPTRRITGDLSDTEKVLAGLDIQTPKPAPSIKTIR